MYNNKDNKDRYKNMSIYGYMDYDNNNSRDRYKKDITENRDHKLKKPMDNVDKNNKDKDNKPESLSSNPRLWGPMMWTLLHELALNGLKNPNIINSVNIEQEYNKIIRSLPYIIPCSLCRSHTKEAYEYGKISRSISKPDKFNEWVWRMKNIANENTRGYKLSYENYQLRLDAKTTFAHEQEIWDLLFIISINYPNKGDSDENRQQYYNTFFVALGTLLERIDHLNRFKILKDIKGVNDRGVWEGIPELQVWLSDIYKQTTGKTADIQKFVTHR